MPIRLLFQRFFQTSARLGRLIGDRLLVVGCWLFDSSSDQIFWMTSSAAETYTVLARGFRPQAFADLQKKKRPDPFSPTPFRPPTLPFSTLFCFPPDSGTNSAMRTVRAARVGR